MAIAVDKRLQPEQTPAMPDGVVPFVSVIIPVYNDFSRLEVCLRALEKQTYPQDKYEVIVVDNGSDRPIESVADTFSKVRIAREEKRGSYAARNKGISLARGEVLAFTDSDCIPRAEWLENGVAQLMSVPNCGLVAGKVDIFARDKNRPRASELFDQLFYLDQEHAVNKKHYGATANLFTFRSVVEKVGVFNDELKSSGDSEWGQRVHEHGYALAYAGAASVMHPARESVRALYRKTVRITGGLYDLKNGQRSSGSTWKAIFQELRMWKPPVRHLYSILLNRGEKPVGGAGKRAKVALIALLLHYSRRVEFLRLALGGRSKNY